MVKFWTRWCTSLAVTWAIVAIFTGSLHPSGWPEGYRQSAGTILAIIAGMLVFVGIVDSFVPRRYDRQHDDE